jgi:hypothetical protein
MSKEKESGAWLQQLWRPMMGWMYMLICTADMLVFPVLWAFWQGYNHVPITQWNPLTLQGAGLFHIAMGAVLGISAFGRTQEKLAGTAANPTATESISVNTQNMTGNVAGGFGSGATNNNMGGGFGGATNGGFGSTGGASGFGAPAGGFGSSSGGFGSASTSPASSTASPAGFGSSTGGFGSAPAAAPVTGQVATGFGGKAAPVLAPDPVL